MNLDFYTYIQTTNNLIKHCSKPSYIKRVDVFAKGQEMIWRRRGSGRRVEVQLNMKEDVYFE